VAHVIQLQTLMGVTIVIRYVYITACVCRNNFWNNSVADLGFSKGGFWLCKSSAQNYS